MARFLGTGTKRVDLPEEAGETSHRDPSLEYRYVLVDQLLKGPRHDVRSVRVGATLAFIVGGLLLLWSSYIHFHLWQKVGYRYIPTIGPLFLVQSIGGVLLGILIIAIRRVWVAILGIGFGASTMAGFLISVEHGLFGFKDAWSAPFAHQAFAIEAAVIAVLVLASALCLVGAKTRGLLTSG
jgi:hypothetical protein